jgi:hypothetical protein
MPTCAKCEKEGTHSLSRFLDVRNSWLSVILGVPFATAILFLLASACVGALMNFIGVPENIGVPFMLGVAGMIALSIPVSVIRDMVRVYQGYRKTGPQYLCENCYRDATYVEPSPPSDDNSFISTW